MYPFVSSSGCLQHRWKLRLTTVPVTINLLLWGLGMHCLRPLCNTANAVKRFDIFVRFSACYKVHNNAAEIFNYIVKHICVAIWIGKIFLLEVFFVFLLSLLQFISRQGLHALLIIHCLPLCLSLFCTVLFKNRLYGNSSASDFHLYSAEVNLGGCRLKDDRWTEVSVKWPWRIAENTDFCEQGVERHFVSGTLWKCSGIEEQFSVNRTLETNITQNMCTVIWFSESRVRLR